MQISVTYWIDVDVESWADASNVSVEDAKADALASFGRMNPASGQTYATLIRTSAIEEY